MEQYADKGNAKTYYIWLFPKSKAKNIGQG